VTSHAAQTADDPSGDARRGHVRRFWRWVIWSVLLGCGVLVLVLQILLARAGPIVKGRVVETLRAHFHSRVELDRLTVSIDRGLQITGSGLRIYPPDDAVGVAAKAPLIQVQTFSFRAPVLGLMFKPMHVRRAQVTGLLIDIPPRRIGQQGPSHGRRDKIKIRIGEILCDDSRLIIESNQPNKDPRIFQLRRIVMHDVGPREPWRYDAVLTNAVPRGDIHATGTLGPWDLESPADSAVAGKYLFDHAQLETIKGIGGMLHSTGSFQGQLNHIAVHGTADVPDFWLDTAHHPMPLATTFSAIVDGTTGDTYLQSVDAKLAGSNFSCRGAVIDVKGKGHIVNLDVDVPHARIQDFLQLSVRTEPVVMSGVIETKSALHIPPGEESVSQKMSMKGQFDLQQIHFTNPSVEDKVDMLSLRAEGEPREAKPGAPDVHSSMSGQFALSDGALHFEDLNYDLPGATVHLAGVYSLDGQRFDFTGDVRTKAELSQMMASKWKQILLTPIDPFFHRHGAGAQIPVKITGTRSAPHFGLNLLGGKPPK
jgi:hypothetical protein